ERFDVALEGSDRSSAVQVLVLVGLVIIAPAHAPRTLVALDEDVPIPVVRNDAAAAGALDPPRVGLGGDQDALAARVEGKADLIDQLVIHNAAGVRFIQSADLVGIDPRRPAHFGQVVSLLFVFHLTLSSPRLPGGGRFASLGLVLPYLAGRCVTLRMNSAIVVSPRTR